jgi:hypothetical protein
MTRDKRGYYYRSRREGGTVVRDYLGKGEIGGLMFQLDELQREKRKDDQEFARIVREESERLDQSVALLNELADLFAKAALVAAGFHQHHRGQWRRKRG